MRRAAPPARAGAALASPVRVRSILLPLPLAGALACAGPAVLPLSPHPDTTAAPHARAQVTPEGTRWLSLDDLERTIESRDLDADGRVDVRVEYGADGLPARITEDVDGDGRAENVTRLEAGRVVSGQRDTDADGLPDLWIRRLSDGRLRHAADRDADGFADEVWIEGEP